MSRSLVHAVLTAWIAASAPGGEPVLLYHVTPMPDLPGGYASTEATDINDAGQVCGYSGAQAGFRPFVWDRVNGMRELGALGNYDTLAESINELGQVAGVSYNTAGDVEAFLWDPETGMIGLGDLPGFVFYSWARGINDWAEVTGSSHTWDPREGSGNIGFIWDADKGMRSIGDLPGGQYISIANDINNDAWIVGWSASYDDWGEPFLWTPRDGIRSLRELNGGRYVGEDAYDINNRGQVVGAGYHGGPGTSGFLWDPDQGLTVIEDRTLGVAWQAYGINDRGEVVGENRAGPPQRDFQGFIWDAENGMRILQHMLDASSRASPYDRIATAYRINERGQIIADTYAPGDVLLTPIVLGDLDCDGSVSWSDVAAFLDALVDPQRYQQRYPQCERWAADINQDARIDASDIEPFLSLMVRIANLGP